MKLRSYLFFYGWFILIYLVLLLVGGLGWIITHKDGYMTVVFIGIVFYHVGSYFVDAIPVQYPAPILPPDDVI